MTTEKQNSQQKLDYDQESEKFFFSGTTPVNSQLVWCHVYATHVRGFQAESRWKTAGSIYSSQVQSWASSK